MDLQAMLLAVGFTEYEARVYITLLQDYPTTGYQIGKRAGIARSMVYEALGRLHARGAVLETREGRASLYRPTPPEVLLDSHEQEQRRLIDGLRKGLGEIYNAEPEEYVWSISGLKSTQSYARQMFRQAETEIYVVLDDSNLAALRNDLADAVQRGIDVNTLLTGNAVFEHGKVAYHPPLESELQELHSPLLTIVDGRETLIASGDIDVTATVTRNHNLVLIARQFVWMELFTQRIYAKLGQELLTYLEPEDRRIFESMANQKGH